MASYNRVILLGNLTRDPELKYLPSGMAVADIGLAVNDRRKNANGEWIEETTFVDITLFGRTAEVVGEYVTKGSPLFIEGRLKFESWETADHQKRSKLKVIGDRIQLLSSKGGSGGGQSGPARPAMARPAGNQYNQANQNSQADPYSQPVPPDDFGPSPSDQSGGDDIPF
jgi:single-strand DNA-binding protein